MIRFAILSLILAPSISIACADETKPIVRPISDSESVLAVYRDNFGLASGGQSAEQMPIIFVAWPDGHVVWSGDRLKGGAPYRTGQVDAGKITSLLAHFEKDGLFDDEKLNKENFGPDSQFITILIKSGKKQVQMQSWHELYEASGKTVADDHGISGLEGRRRLDVLRASPAEYLFYRFVWSETRATLAELIPSQSNASAGGPIMKGLVLSWQEPANAPGQFEK